jgi:hypothetical protein
VLFRSPGFETCDLNFANAHNPLGFVIWDL